LNHVITHSLSKETKMKKTEVTPNDVQETTQNQSLLITAKAGAITKVGGGIKRMIILTSLAGIGLFFNGCTAGYVATEPSYVEYSRPQRPSDLHIWIDGDWVFNTQTHAYVQRNGYWERPVQGRTYISGSWQSTPRGKYWSKGHWQKKGGNGNRNSR
jgi:hypothetical protein